jgi:hypothetical protein
VRPSWPDDGQIHSLIYREAKLRTHLYRPLLQPASSYTLPAGVDWDYVQAPAIGGLINWFGLLQSRHPFGVIRTDRELTTEECKCFDLAPLVCDTMAGRRTDNSATG